MARGRDWFLGLLLLAAAGIFIFFIASIFFGRTDNNDGFELSTGRRVGLIEVKGVILDSETTVKNLERYGSRQDIAAIILRIDSPGGGVAASQEIYEAVKRVREGGKFVIASMASVAASGGYYIACGADTIMANPGTTTGSIGVIAEMLNATELMQKIGVRFEVIKSGKFKDTGSPFRPMNEEDRLQLQSYVDNAYQQFVNVVATERDLTTEQVLKYADGRIYTGQQAHEIRLIDLLGTYEDAVDLAGKMGGITGKARVIKPPVRKTTMWDLLFGDIEQHLIRLQTLPVLRYQMIF